MNERIMELAKQAGYEKDSFGIGHWDMPECKKFAELIIQESIEVMMTHDYHGEWLGEKLKQHFGVE